MRFILPIRLIAQEFFLVIVACHSSILHSYHIVLHISHRKRIWEPSHDRPLRGFANDNVELEFPFLCLGDDTSVVADTAAVVVEDVIVVINCLIVNK